MAINMRLLLLLSFVSCLALTQGHTATDLLYEKEFEIHQEQSQAQMNPLRQLVKDENEKCVSCIKSGMKYCEYGESAHKCCEVTDFSPHCQYNCSNQLVSNSIYSQYRKCPQREQACGERYVNSTQTEQYLSSQHGLYRSNITCVYQITNLEYQNPIYLTIYRKTNDSEIAIYFRQENPDGTREYSTIVYEFPLRGIYQGLDKDKWDGEPFRNSTDVMKQYTFDYVSQLTIVTIGLSESSQFDFGISVSALSTKTWKNLKLATYIVVGSLLGSTFLYVVIKKLVKALKKRSHTELEDEVEDSDRIDSAGKEKQ